MRPFIQESSVLRIVSVFAPCPILVEVNVQNVAKVVFNFLMTSNDSGALFCDMGILEVQRAIVVAIKRTNLSSCLVNALCRSLNDRSFIQPDPLLQ